MIEKRQFTRIAFDASASLSHAGQEWSAQLLDISLKGVLMDLPQAGSLSINTEVSVNMLLSDGETEIQMDGHVAHIEGQHVGIACDHVDVDSASHLRRIVELNTGNEELLERELEALVSLTAL